MCIHDVRGQLKTWKLLARFSAASALWPWDKPQQCQDKRPHGIISGDNVWGVSYEDIWDWSRTATSEQLVQRLAKDLQTSYDYSHQRYRQGCTTRAGWLKWMDKTYSYKSTFLSAGVESLPGTMPRRIMHINLDAFFASAEQVLNPKLKGKPVLGGKPDRRGVVSSASYEAGAFGLPAGMPLVTASRLCPEVTFIEGNFL